MRGRLTVQEGRNVQYSGIVHAARTILRDEGPLAFYKVCLCACYFGRGRGVWGGGAGGSLVRICETVRGLLL